MVNIALLHGMAEDMACRLSLVTGQEDSDVKELEALEKIAWDMAHLLQVHLLQENKEDVAKGDTTQSETKNPMLILVDSLKELLDKKEDLAEQTKENNKEIEATKNDLAQMMVNEECPSVSRNGFKYILQEKVMYQKKSEEDLAQNDVPFFDFLRDEGMGDIIKETVDSRTLSSTIKSMVEEVGELPEHYLNYIRPYETLDIMKRKETNTVAKNKKKAGETDEGN